MLKMLNLDEGAKDAATRKWFKDRGWIKSEGGRPWCFRAGKVGLNFFSSVWILVLLLGTGAQTAYPGLRNLLPSRVPARQLWELLFQIRTTPRGSVPGQGGMSTAWCDRVFCCGCQWHRGSESLKRAASRSQRSGLGGHSQGLACQCRAFHREKCGLGSSEACSPWLWWTP